MYEQLQTHCSDRQSLSEDRRLHGTCSPSCPPWSEGTSHLTEQLTGKETLPSFCPSFTHGLHLGAIPALLLSSLSCLLLHCTATPANQLPMLLADRYASKQSHSSPFSSLPPAPAVLHSQVWVFQHNKAYRWAGWEGCEPKGWWINWSVPWLLSLYPCPILPEIF